MAAYNWTGRELGDAIIQRLRNLLGVFVGAVLYFVIVYHVTNLYITEHHDVEKFILLDGGIYTSLFWVGQIILGSLVPLALIYAPGVKTCRKTLGLASTLIIVGGMCQMYVIIIGGQAFPIEIFPGYEIVQSSFFDAGVNEYTPSIYEILLGLGGVAVTLIAVVFAVKVLGFLPTTLADAEVDPHA